MSPEALNLLGYDLLADIAVKLRSHELRRDNFSRLTSNSGEERMEAVLLRESVGRVSLPGAIKKFMKQRFPAFSFDHAMGDWHRFSRTISDDLSLFVEFERIHHYGLGKTFTVYLGASPGDWRVVGHKGFRENVMSFFDRASMDWIYGTTGDLEDCLEEVAVLLTILLPLYCDAWRASKGRPASQLRQLTFYEAAEMAFSRIAGIYPQFSSMGHASWINTPLATLPAGTWSISFNDNDADRIMSVQVFPNGALLFALGNQLYIRQGDAMERAYARRFPDEHLALPSQPTPVSSLHHRPWTVFLDSTPALEIANRNGGAEFASKCSTFSTDLQLDAQRSDPPREDESWRVFYSDSGPDRRHAHVRLSARTGTVLSN